MLYRNTDRRCAVYNSSQINDWTFDAFIGGGGGWGVQSHVSEMQSSIMLCLITQTKQSRDRLQWHSCLNPIGRLERLRNLVIFDWLGAYVLTSLVWSI